MPRTRAIKKGDLLKPDPLWNETSNESLQLPNVCEALEIKQASAGNVMHSGSGTMIKVRLVSGAVIHLDSAWFILPKNCTERNTGLQNMLRNKRVSLTKKKLRRYVTTK